jgi:hypothetical protein
MPFAGGHNRPAPWACVCPYVPAFRWKPRRGGGFNPRPRRGSISRGHCRTRPTACFNPGPRAGDDPAPSLAPAGGESIHGADLRNRRWRRVLRSKRSGRRHYTESSLTGSWAAMPNKCARFCQRTSRRSTRSMYASRGPRLRNTRVVAQDFVEHHSLERGRVAGWGDRPDATLRGIRDREPVRSRFARSWMRPRSVRHRSSRRHDHVRTQVHHPHRFRDWRWSASRWLPAATTRPRPQSARRSRRRALRRSRSHRSKSPLNCWHLSALRTHSTRRRSDRSCPTP